MNDGEPLVDWKALHGDRFKSVRALVTGAAGFIGSHLVEALVELGAGVVAFDDLSAGCWENLEGFDRSVEKTTASILDQSAINQAAEGCHYLFHQAALGSVPKSLAEPVRYTDVNVRGTACVLEAARAAGVKRLLFASSSSVYGNPPDEQPRAEDASVQPLSPYAATKSSGEQLLRAWSESYGLDAVALRYFNVFGPRQNADSDYAAVIAAFGKAMASGRSGTVYGDGEQARDFTYVANVVHGNLLAASCDRKLAGEVFNIACGHRISINRLHRQMAELFDMGGAEPVYENARSGEVRLSQADIRRAEEALKYRPQVDFDQGLRSLVQALRN